MKETKPYPVIECPAHKMVELDPRKPAFAHLAMGRYAFTRGRPISYASASEGFKGGKTPSWESP